MKAKAFAEHHWSLWQTSYFSLNGVKKKKRERAFVFSNLFSVRRFGITITVSANRHCLPEECWEWIYDLLNLLAPINCFSTFPSIEMKGGWVFITPEGMASFSFSRAMGSVLKLLPNGNRRKVIEDPQSLHVALDRTGTLNGESGDRVSKAVSGLLNVKFVSPLWTPVSLSVTWMAFMLSHWSRLEQLLQSSQQTKHLPIVEMWTLLRAFHVQRQRASATHA